LFLDIDLSKTPQRPKLYLCKPNKTIIAPLPEHYGANLKINLTTLNELTFDLPYKLDINNKIQHNIHCDLIKNRFLIKLILGEYIAYFIINNPAPNADDSSDFYQINCYSLEYELKDKEIRVYKSDSVSLKEVMNGFSRDTTIITDGISTTTTDVTPGILKDTAWVLGNYPVDLDSVYRSFDVSVKTKLDFVLDVAEKFNLVAQFDSTTRLINFYTIDKIGVNKGLRISDKRYLKTIVQNIDSETFCTRLKLYGKDGLTISEINPTAQSHIENFSYFLFPFERDINRTVISHSDYMSDELCHAILDYELLLVQNKGTYPILLASLAILQTEMTVLTNEMAELVIVMKEIEDNIATASGSKKAGYEEDKIAQQILINAQQALITVKQLLIDNLNTQITNATTSLSYETFFQDMPKLLEELQESYIIEKSWTNDSLISAEDLYIYGLDEMESRKNPVTIIQINIVNFLEIISEQYNWNKINLGDSIAIKHEQLGIDLTARIIEVSFDFESAEIQLTISNVKSKNSKLEDILYQTSSLVDIIDVNKLKWDKSQITATEYVDQQIQEMVGTLLNLSIDISRFGEDGFITKSEANALKLTLEQAIAESENVIKIAEDLEIVTEKNDYVIALIDLETELRQDWIDQPNYPIQIISDESPEDERIIISTLFKTVEDTKSKLINAIGQARQDDGKRYVETQVAELNTALSAFQTQVNVYINAKPVGQITETESITLSGLFVDVQHESDDIVAIANGLMEIIGDDNDLYNDLRDAKNAYSNVQSSSGAIYDVLHEIDDWFNKSSYPITIKPSKGVSVNKKIKNVETRKNTLVDLITQVQIDNELTLVDQQLFEVSVAITSMQMDITTFAKDNYITYDESVSLKASFNKINSESEQIIDIANSMSISATIINNYQNSLTGTIVLNGVDGLQVELLKWVDLPLESYAGKGLKITSKQRKALLKKFDLVMSTKLILSNAITLATPEYSIDGEISIQGTGANHSGSRFLKLNKKQINASSLSNSLNKGLMLTVISREDLSIVFTQCYHTFDSDEADRNTLATKLNSLDDTVIVVLTSYDSIGWNQTLLDAMIRCGGTGTNTGVGKFPFAFIGIPGLFKGNALEVFTDSGSHAPYANITTKILDGTPQGIAIGTTVISAEAMLAVQKAESDKDVAMIDINKITSNVTLTSTEKKTAKKYWDAIVNEKVTVELQSSYWNTADYPDVVSTLAIYETKYSDLSSYIVPILSIMTSSSTIVTSTFISAFTQYYDSKISLLKAIMGVARNYIGDAISGLAESLIGLAKDISDAFSDSKIDAKEASKFFDDLTSLNAESTPLIDLASTLGLIDAIKPATNEKTDYQDALTTLSATLGLYIGKDNYPISVDADDKKKVTDDYANVQTTKTLLITKISTLQLDNAKTYSNTILTDFQNNVYNIDKEDFQSQIDGKIEVWFSGYVPTLLNSPASTWSVKSTTTTKTLRDAHLGDLFYQTNATNTNSGLAYKFTLTGTTYAWTPITDIAVIESLYQASITADTLDGNRRIFTESPSPPYDLGDLWSTNGASGDLLICTTKKSLGGSFSSSDWTKASKYTDDTLAQSILDDISIDNKLSISEKRIVSREWNIIETEYSSILSQVEISVSSGGLYIAPLYIIPYSNAYNGLASYITTLELGSSTTTNINRTDFNNWFEGYNSAKSQILIDIANSVAVKIVSSSGLEDATLALSTANNALTISNGANSTANSAISAANYATVVAGSAVPTSNSYTDAQIVDLKVWIDANYVAK